MRPRQSPKPVMGRLIAAINAGNRDAFPATLSPDAPLTDHRSRTSARSGQRAARGSQWASRAGGTTTGTNRWWRGGGSLDRRRR